MKLSFIILSSLVAIVSSYPAPDVKPDTREVTPSQIQLNDPKAPITQDKTRKPKVADMFSKMSNCGQPCDASIDCEGGGIGHCYSCYRGTCH
ncbi:hypothetical protein TWF718_004157 [Orbilia javanica]|uniref:Uncharacterized protein n=1 Tax=Orbilia javanica TaxID=47235 RepID=A0AAN8RKL4_9PEZI